MRLGKRFCPACGQGYEDDGEERLLPLRGYQHAVCKPCYLAFLKTRVMAGDKLKIEDLWKIGQVREKVKKSVS